uniref:Uncharacterized protein n=1 Tax=Scleropages formosus TaxID=113540 RepID=A0A8C9WRI3_SCLFO
KRVPVSSCFSPPSPRSPHRANPTQKTKTNYCWSRFYWDCDQDVDNSSLDAKEQDDVTYVSLLFLTITNPRHFTLMTGNETDTKTHMYWSTCSGVLQLSILGFSFI